MDFELKVRKILAESCGWGLASVQLDTRLVEDLDMDSMELVAFVGACRRVQSLAYESDTSINDNDL